MRTISHFINGQSVTRPGAITSPVYDPSTGQVQALLEHGDAAILSETVAAAKAAQPAWAAIDPLRRARVRRRRSIAPRSPGPPGGIPVGDPQGRHILRGRHAGDQVVRVGQV